MLWKSSISRSLPSLELPLAFPLQDGRCLSCHFRRAGYQVIARRYNGNRNGVKDAVTSSKPSTEASGHPQDTESGSGSPKEEGEFTPLVLDRPIGLIYPPQEGQNTGIDTRSIKERRDDFVDYQKHVQRRKELTKQVAKPYFREWSNLRYHEGKTFQSNPRLFKRDKSLYFPNLAGTTLASPSKPQDTTSILRGRISVVSLFSGMWAEQQVATFTGLEKNPGLYEILQSNPSLAQKIDVNVEENVMRAWLVRMFMWRMRRQLPPEQHGKYFLVRKGLTDGLREAIGMLNSKVGYVYLLDDACHIRWAGSGPAEPSETESLNNGIQRLVEEKRKRLESDVPVTEWESTKQDPSEKVKPRVVVR